MSDRLWPCTIGRHRWTQLVAASSCRYSFARVDNAPARATTVSYFLRTGAVLILAYMTSYHSSVLTLGKFSHDNLASCSSLYIYLASCSSLCELLCKTSTFHATFQKKAIRKYATSTTTLPRLCALVDPWSCTIAVTMYTCARCLRVAPQVLTSTHTSSQINSIQCGCCLLSCHGYGYGSASQ